MKYDIIADGGFVREEVRILKELGTWNHMTEEEKSIFKPCRKCAKYNEYALDKGANTRPCDACEHHKTETQIVNRMIMLRRKY